MSDKRGVFRIADVETILRPSIAAFIIEALGTDKLVLEPERAFAELVRAVEFPGLAIFVGHEGQEWKCFALVQWSQTALQAAACVLHIYNKGSAGLRRVLLTEIVEFARAGGFHRIVGFDTNGKSAAFMRLFQAVGRPEVVGTATIFNLDEGVL
jgi:hypothetical protein